jgi:hypothetical protein
MQQQLLTIAVHQQHQLHALPTTSVICLVICPAASGVSVRTPDPPSAAAHVSVVKLLQ